ncbi:MAG: hypothetical protein A2040_15585 [Rhodocyclales bacterium GWA2_65_19]|nr:MAG: hypothetical protein A2040_15585 [Rhodocyclales bacterium GWA2_65_19]
MNGYLSLGRPPRIEPPYPGWPSEQIATVEEAIAEAMRRVRAEKSSRDIFAAQENELTNWLHRMLWRLLVEQTVPGFTCDVFSPPQRGAKTTSHDGSRVSLEPDLSFFRCGIAMADNPDDGWFCECKILDDGSSHGVPNYIKDGLMRFVIGDYAWAMPSAQMIGYVRHAAGKGCVPAKRLHEQFAKLEPKSGKSYAVLTGLLAEKAREPHTDGVLQVHATTHARGFPLRDECAPGPITLRHLWFQLG